MTHNNPSVLMITTRFPYPPWRGQQVRTAEWLAALRGRRLGLVTPVSADGGADVPEGIELFTHRASLAERGAGLVTAAMSGRPLQEGPYDHRSARRAVRRALAEGPWDVVVVQMIRCAWAVDEVRSLAPGSKILFDAIDAMGLHYERAVPGYRWYARPAVRLEAARCRRREAVVAGMAAVSTAVASRDLDAMQVPDGRRRVVPVSGNVVPQGTKPSRQPVVLLSGNLGYRPTVRGACWFSEAVWPEVRRRVDGVRWMVAGARPHRAVRRLQRLEGVEVHGNVADLAPFLISASVAVAPMATGSGVPLKVLEAWAAGLPVVMDPWAAAGVEGDPGPVVASTPEEWVETLVGLLTDSRQAAEAATIGHEVWRASYHPNRVSAAVRDAVAAAAQ